MDITQTYLVCLDPALDLSEPPNLLWLQVARTVKFTKGKKLKHTNYRKVKEIRDFLVKYKKERK